MTRHLVIIGGGVAGLSAGCYALRSGFRTTIVEHNLALGGVCTAWHRGQYTIDGCIHWLTGGPFSALYDELGILPAVELRTLETWLTYRDVDGGIEIPITRDLDALVGRLAALSPNDGDELRRLRDAATQFVELKPTIDATEQLGAFDLVQMAWEMRDTVGALVHFRKPIGEWAQTHLRGDVLQQFFTRILPETAPTYFLLMILGYLERGYLSRPVGGTNAFRNALEQTYRSLGGEVMLHATVDEIVVDDGHACGVRLADGSVIPADIVVSTSSAPETVLRLLGGRYDARKTTERLAEWKTFDPIVLASFGVALPYREMPATLLLDGIPPFHVGGVRNDSLYLRIYNDDPSFAPPDHTVVQAMLKTDYDWWATLGSRYHVEKEALAELVIAQLAPHFEGFRSAVRSIDLATPLTYWGMARSWRGSYEGWMPRGDSFFGGVKKKLRGLEGFYMAGQWVEPGGGIPTSIMSGRQAIQLLCSDHKHTFRATDERSR